MVNDMYNGVATGMNPLISGIINATGNWPEPNHVEEAYNHYIDAEAWATVNGYPEDLSEAWKIMPMDVVDPSLEEEWKAQRLWMTDPLDDITGDDAMPALCSTCHGVYWGDEMMSLTKAIKCLHEKHYQAHPTHFSTLWSEYRDHMIAKMRNNRICKKCYCIRAIVRYQNNGTYNLPVQNALPFNYSTSYACSGSYLISETAILEPYIKVQEYLADSYEPYDDEL